MGRVAVIGSGFAGLSAACFLARDGFDVTVFEKNARPGGRASVFQADGFTFDMGPSWYWMPDVFDQFFGQFGKKTSDYYTLERLDPSYRIVYAADDVLDVPAGVEALCRMFERLEPGSSRQLMRFLEEGKFKYDIGMRDLVYQPGLSVRELLRADVIKNTFRLHVFQSISAYIRKFFRDTRLVQLLEFPVLFLGASPEKIPALYSLMNYADMALGTWYPQGGMYRIIEGMTALARELGVHFAFNSPVEKLTLEGAEATGVVVNGVFHAFDYIVAGADYHHVEQHLLPPTHRQYSEAYWQKRVLAPSSLIFFLGINKKLKGLLHHTLFFDEDFRLHAAEIYDRPQWPTAPQFYVSCPSQTDPTTAPAGCENIFILIPVAPGLTDTAAIREQYLHRVLTRLEQLTGQSVREHIVYQRSYAHQDFIQDYNAFKGNAYGLANTLLQTANLKPSMRNKKVRNLFYTGQLTVPGPGVPPALISGQVAARELIKTHKEFVH
jgi:phytoene desaturase